MTVTDATSFTIEAARRVLAAIEVQREVVDAQLTSPARWRGPLRRELGERETDEPARQRYAETFDWLATGRAGAAPLDDQTLRDVHDRVVGGAEYRTGSIRIGDRSVGHPAAADVAGMVAQALSRAGDGVEPPLLAAARLHLELGLIHPFADGNGRCARLLSSAVLIRAGYRSTLLTAVEQFWRFDPALYRISFRRLRNSGHDEATWVWLVRALGTMALSSQLVTWHRLTRARMAERTTPAPLLDPARDELAFQLRRLRAEEREDAGRTA